MSVNGEQQQTLDENRNLPKDQGLHNHQVPTECLSPEHLGHGQLLTGDPTVHQFPDIFCEQLHPIPAGLHGLDLMSTVHKVSSEFGSLAHLSQRVYPESKKPPEPRPSPFLPSASWKTAQAVAHSQGNP
ncbi:uncharacterized protein LOC108164538 [Drosophila miranda]|uniref:uncharacterized protein LOC108164538 n=1 Tax=Drosophila miranda TaxID=7229 RepID=UPI00143F4DA3|nr:uncharacterized protein LOC108164538 [Drosophila miranda]